MTNKEAIPGNRDGFFYARRSANAFFFDTGTKKKAHKKEILAGQLL